MEAGLMKRRSQLWQCRRCGRLWITGSAREVARSGECGMALLRPPTHTACLDNVQNNQGSRCAISHTLSSRTANIDSFPK